MKSPTEITGALAKYFGVPVVRVEYAPTLDEADWAGQYRDGVITLTLGMDEVERERIVVHEFAHHLMVVQRDASGQAPDHGALFYETLVDVAAKHYGDVRLYPWEREEELMQFVKLSKMLTEKMAERAVGN